MARPLFSLVLGSPFPEHKKKKWPGHARVGKKVLCGQTTFPLSQQKRKTSGLATQDYIMPGDELLSSILFM